MKNKSIFGARREKELLHLKELIEVQQELALMTQGYDPDLMTFKVRLIPCIKYTRVDIGRSSRYMVDNDSGIIYGTSGYGRVNRKHVYGTLETVNEWAWGGYLARWTGEHI